MKKSFFSKIWQGAVIASMLFASAANAVVTIYLVGDSTMQDWDAYYYPKQGMGQDFGYFFDSGLAKVFNAGRGGTTSVTYYDGFWSVRGKDRKGNYVFSDAVKNMVKSGDYVMIMIGANDNKKVEQGGSTEEMFKTAVTKMVEETKQKNANPILISPIRRSWFISKDSVYESYHAFPIYMRQLASSLKVPFIDLDTLSRNYLLSLGDVYSHDYINMFVNFNEYSGYTVASKDPTKAQADDQHLQQNGANAFGRIVTEQLRVHSDPTTKKLGDYLAPMYQLDVKVSPAGADSMSTLSAYYPANMPVSLKTTPKANGKKFIGWFDGDGNKVSGNLRVEVKSPYVHTFKMPAKSTQYTAVYEGGSPVKYTGDGKALTKFPTNTPKVLEGINYGGDVSGSGHENDDKPLGPIDFKSIIQAETVAEDSSRFDVGWAESNHLGFTGTGFWNFDNHTGSFASYDLYFPSTATVIMGIVYANGKTYDQKLAINVGDHDYYMSFAPTGGFDKWDTAYVELMLPFGYGDLTFASMDDNGGPNIDCFGFDIKNIYEKGAVPDSVLNHKDSTETKDPESGDSTTTKPDAIVMNSLNVFQQMDADIQVFDMAGRKVSQFCDNKALGSLHNQLSARIANAGTYLVVIRQGRRMTRMNWMKVK